MDSKKARYSGIVTYFDLFDRSTYAILVKTGKETGVITDSKAFKVGLGILKEEFDTIPKAIINRRDDLGRTAFAKCMVFDPEDHIHYAKMLIDAGAKTDTIDMEGFTPCGLLIQNHVWKDAMLMAHMLLKNGLKFTEKEMKDASFKRRLGTGNCFEVKIKTLIKYIEEEKRDNDEEEL